MSLIGGHVDMIASVALALGRDLCERVVFVGGCTTGLLLTDVYAKQQVRHTDDVDLIVHIIARSDWYALMDDLRGKGFRESPQEDAPICAMYLNGLRVDFMPDDPAILSNSNRWYKDAFATAKWVPLCDDIRIRLILPEYFLGTKIAAYLGRGNGDLLASQDIEDLLTLVDGRTELTSEMLRAPRELRDYVSQELSEMLRSPDFEYAVQAASNDRAREEAIFKRIELIVGYGQLG